MNIKIVNTKLLSLLSNWISCLVITFISVQSVFAAENPLANVSIVDIPEGYELEIHHHRPIRYLRHSPGTNSGTQVVVDLSQSLPITFEKDDDRVNWGLAFDVPVKSISIKGLKTTTPKLLVEFTKKVKFDVKNSIDQRTTIVRIETDRPKFTGPLPSRVDGVTNIVIALKPYDPAVEDLLDRASDHMLDQEYPQALQVLMRVRERGNADIQGPVQEIIGLTREYLGQDAQAMAEYEDYLARFPEGEAASRVAQRLNALRTAALAPKKKRKKVAADDDGWQQQVFGSVAQHYYHYQFNTPSQESEVRRSALNTSVYVSARASNDEYDFRARVGGAYQKDFEFDGDRDVVNPTSLSIEGRQKEWGLFARVGRQSRSSGGVLGRFDGAHVAYELSPQFTINGVFGYPMDYLRRDALNTDQQFYGASIDIGDIWEGWEFSSFIIQQDYLDIIDRRAVGGEVRYFDTQKNFFSLVDYDIEYEQLNIFMLNGRWELTSKTAVNGNFQHRANPILVSAGAIQGLGVSYYENLFSTLTARQVQNRIATSFADYSTARLGVSHQLNSDWKIDGDVYATKYGGTRPYEAVINSSTTLEIPAIPETDWEFYYTARATTQGLLLNDDNTILHIRYADTDRHTTGSFGVNWRYNITPELRVNPKFRIDLRSNNLDDDSRIYTRWDFGLDYKVARQIRLNLDMGYDFQQEDTPFVEFTSTGLYVNAGYRYTF